MTSKPSIYTRSYKLTAPANAGKINRIRSLVRKYQHGLTVLVASMDQRLIQDAKPPNKYTDSRAILNLSARQTQSCYAQARESYSSWLRSLQKTVKRIITLSTLDPHTKDVLYRLNYHMAWYAKIYELDWMVARDGELVHPTTAERRGGKTTLIPVSDEHLWLMRRIVKHARRTNHRPDLSHETTMKMDAKIAVLEESRGTGFSWWLRTSTLDRGQPVLIPVKDNRFFARKRVGGRLLNHVQLGVVDDRLSVSLVVEKPCAPLRGDGDVIAFDWGLVSLFTLPDGRMLGRSTLAELKRLDALLMDRVKKLSSKGLRLRGDSCYDSLVSRSRSLMENEIGRLLNILAANAREIIVEDLDFRGGGLSKRMNRILSRSGRGFLNRKLQALHEEKGIIVTKIDPAYTSQECSACGYVSKRNRRDQASFKCGCCGRALNADVNAARIIGGRSSDVLPRGRGAAHRKTLYDVLENRHRASCGAWLARHTTAGL
jgi:putative transposase